MTTRSIRVKKPADPFQPEIDRTLAARRSMKIEREIVAAAGAINRLRNDMGYRSATVTDVMSVWAGATEGLI